MPLVGFHVSHEQLAPSAGLAAVQLAEQAGFDAAMCSDHLAPWSRRQGESGHSWSWLGAALATTSLPVGVVTAPGQRAHPAVVAQAIATLGEMFPGRFWAALGSGEALNEHVTGERWPRKEVRDARLDESVAVIRRLLDGEEVSHDGLITVDRARVWSLPSETPPLIGAAVSAPTARRSGGWADGLITVNQPLDVLREVIEAFHEGGGEGRPVYVQIHLSWDDDADRAVELAFDQWRTNVFGSSLAWNLETPDQFDDAAESVRPEDVRQSVVISSDPAAHAACVHDLFDLGVDGVYLHHVGKEQERFIETFAERVIPELRT